MTGSEDHKFILSSSVIVGLTIIRTGTVDTIGRIVMFVGESDMLRFALLVMTDVDGRFVVPLCVTDGATKNIDFSIQILKSIDIRAFRGMPFIVEKDLGVERLNLLIGVVNSLRAKGLAKYAAWLDRFVRKYAQEGGFPPIGSEDPFADLGGEEVPPAAPGADPTAGPTDQAVAPQPATPTPEQQNLEKPDEQNILQRTFYYQFEKWHDVLDRELPHFDYLGKENIAAIRSSLAGVHKAFVQAFQTKPNAYDKAAVLKWNAYVNDLVKKMKDSQQKKLNGTKAIVDASMLYGTTNRMYESAKRIFGDDPAFSRALEAFADLIRVFANVIKQTSEQIAQRDLTEVR